MPKKTLPAKTFRLMKIALVQLDAACHYGDDDGLEVAVENAKMALNALGLRTAEQKEDGIPLPKDEK